MSQDVRIAKQIREELKATKYRMAVKLGITPQSWEVLETKSTNVHLKHLISLWHIAKSELGWDASKFLAYLEAEQTLSERDKRRGEK